MKSKMRTSRKNSAVKNIEPKLGTYPTADGYKLVQQNGGREFADGDHATTGFHHVAFVDGGATFYKDKSAVR